jgi:hypothetical protein
MDTWADARAAATTVRCSEDRTAVGGRMRAVRGLWGATGSFGGVPRGSRAKSARFRIKRGEMNIKNRRKPKEMVAAERAVMGN